MKSPLKDKPLHNPGESLDRQIEKLINEDANTYLLAIGFFLLMTFLEWWRWIFNVKPSPLLYSIMTLLVSPFLIYKLFKLKKKLKYLRQGRDGEKAVGQYLESLRETSARVFHDIPAENFNLDHVVIGKSGIYVIETKTYSKPDSGQPKIIFDGQSLRLNSGVITDKPIIQVQAAVRWLSELIKQTTGRTFPVKPVVVFPGWFIEPTSEAKSSDVWVLNPKGLPTFIANSKERMTDDDVSLASFHLSRYIRTFKKE